ncbi:MAG: hypothetical protein JRI25_00785 [Deltaproteobacteria bacterium]|nr:hypothetical protein [Deltaproteobacteria bacterium]
MYTGMLHAHQALAYLLMLSTTLSVAVAVAYALYPQASLLRIGGILARGVETSAAGLIGVIGVAMWVAIGLPLATWWMWAGLAAVVGSGVLIARFIKPSLAGLREGDRTRRWWWVGFALFHWLWISAIFGIMQSQ